MVIVYHTVRKSAPLLSTAPVRIPPVNAQGRKCVKIVEVALRPTKLFLCFLTVAVAAQAGEFVVLSNGFRIHADNHIADGSVIRLQTSQGVIEIQASNVAAFEQEDYTAPVAPSAATLVSPPPVVPTPTPQELVTRAALHAGLPPAIVHSIARAESGYREDAVSPKGAIGLMQLMPKTAAELDADPHDPAQNADAGADTCAICCRSTRTIRIRFRKRWPPTTPDPPQWTNITASRPIPRPFSTSIAC